MVSRKSVTITRDGPYLVEGLPLTIETVVADEGGRPLARRVEDRLDVPEAYSLCRCGASGDKPFCDGAHASIG